MKNAFALPSLAILKTGARVGILGGSFDPPHLSHQLLALSLISLVRIDELWIIPCVYHAFKSAIANFSHRLALCELAFSSIRCVRVLNIEQHLAQPNYTINTIGAIKAIRSDLKLVLCIGSDLINDFSKWRDAEEIVKTADIVLFERIDYPITNLPKLLSRAEICRGYPLPDAASTSIRDMLERRDKSSLPSLLDRKVLHYINEHGLYAK